MTMSASGPPTAPREQEHSSQSGYTQAVAKEDGVGFEHKDFEHVGSELEMDKQNDFNSVQATNVGIESKMVDHVEESDLDATTHFPNRSERHAANISRAAAMEIIASGPDAYATMNADQKRVLEFVLAASPRALIIKAAPSADKVLIDLVACRFAMNMSRKVLCMPATLTSVSEFNQKLVQNLIVDPPSFVSEGRQSCITSLCASMTSANFATLDNTEVLDGAQPDDIDIDVVMAELGVLMETFDWSGANDTEYAGYKYSLGHHILELVGRVKGQLPCCISDSHPKDLAEGRLSAAAEEYASLLAGYHFSKRPAIDAEFKRLWRILRREALARTSVLVCTLFNFPFFHRLFAPDLAIF